MLDVTDYLVMLQKFQDENCTTQIAVRIALRSEISKRDRDVYWMEPYKLAVIFRKQRPLWLVSWEPIRQKARFRPGDGGSIAVIDGGSQLTTACVTDVGDVLIEFRGPTNMVYCSELSRDTKLVPVLMTKMKF